MRREKNRLRKEKTTRNVIDLYPDGLQGRHKVLLLARNPQNRVGARSGDGLLGGDARKRGGLEGEKR